MTAGMVLLVIAAVGSLFVVPIVIMIHEPRRARRLRRGLCTRCGYDMLHVDHASCPECGHRWEDD